jgi:hypothetical protein
MNQKTTQLPKVPPIFIMLDKILTVLSRKIYLAELERDRQTCALEIIKLKEIKQLRQSVKPKAKEFTLDDMIDLFKQMEFDARKHSTYTLLGGRSSATMENGTGTTMPSGARHNGGA